MLNTNNMSICDYINKVAVPANKFHSHRNTMGKLTGYVPKLGQIAVLEGFDQIGKVVREPNSVKDFLIELEDGSKLKKNLVNRDIEGYIDV